jgi:hypothetical protein
MKNNPARLLTLLAASLLFVAFAHADEAAYAQILKKREAVLSQILASRESMYKTGITDGEAVWSAQLTLWSFRRDSATPVAEKIRQQELIVSGWEKRLAEVESRAKAGIGGAEAKLLATDQLLQAQQLLEELRLQPKKS